MNILIIYAHPEPKSFNEALKDLAVSELTLLGHQVKVSDLYDMNFKAVADSDDFIKRENNEFLKYAVEQKNAVKTNSFLKDIQEEQEKLVWADFVIFQFPLWWYSVPAILKDGLIEFLLRNLFIQGICGMTQVASKEGKQCYQLLQVLQKRHILHMEWMEIYMKKSFIISIMGCFILRGSIL